MLRVHWIFEKPWPVYIAAHKFCDYELVTTYIALSLSEGSNISQYRPKDRLYIFRAFWYEKVYLAIHFISKVGIYFVCPSRKMFSLNMSLNMNRTSWSSLLPYPAESIYLNFQPLEVASRCRDPQPQVVENYSYLFNLRPNICKFCCLNSHFIPNKKWIHRLIKWIKNDYCRDQQAKG